MLPSPQRDTIAAEVTSSIEEKLKNLRSISSQDKFVCISIVPDGLRKVKPPCFTPRLVAIGPLHHDIPQLKPMEDLKLRFFQEFKRMMYNNMGGIINFIVEWIMTIRFCYGETKNIPQNNDLCEMMLLDSIFIIQIFLKKSLKDPIFDNYWWFRDLMHDFLLLENQIPLVIPYAIYSKHYLRYSREHSDIDFILLANNFFEDVKMTSDFLPKWENFDDPFFSPCPRHFPECLMVAYFRPVPSPLNPPSQPVSLQLDSTPPLPLTQKKSNKKGSWKFGVATASRLLEYGVKFEVDTNTTTLVAIQFKDGILKIPRIRVNDWTETLFCNLIAFEHCQHLTPRYVTDYIIFMDSLIDTPEDVNILTNKGIIEDALQDPAKVSVLFDNLYKEVTTENRHYHFAQLSSELNDYRRNPWHQWKAAWYNLKVILRRDYFNSPWSFYSFLAAVIALVLTLVQTVCSILQA